MADDSLPDYEPFGNRKQSCGDRLMRRGDRLRKAAGVEVGENALSTKGSLTKRTGRLCPRRLRNWADCLDSQQQLYNSIRKFLHASEEDAPRLFSSPAATKCLEYYERLAVEDNVRYVIAELCKIPDAREEFKLEDGVQFDNHANALTDVEFGKPDVEDQDKIFYRVKGNTNILFTTAEYKPPHKLSVESLRAGLRPMDFYEKVVQVVTIPKSECAIEVLCRTAEWVGSGSTIQCHDPQRS
ncbi:hypothetical protein POJ06DRAFT_303098 [Lipomyces tetrasporus]|uniref:Uncharacterized protein n=1 Tax=Lipomyces tetrasporus TaxID=54092 RepID=A0AAD7QP92_9ASCO|nr:uncharacterized protein POJ06DRAFT_303098 [Lipomyces tetrasporus]KAJ8098421.1 hypothetical protein POJ06DRAFT_303098 [Lipomyces tetrasporus]